MKAEDIKTVSVIGAGLMGHGIAQTFAQAGYQVNLTTRREETLRGALNKIRANVERMVENGLLSRDKAEAVFLNLKATNNRAEAVKDADFVIETVKEDPELKKELLSEIGAICPSHTIFATNTSSISLAELAPVTKRGDRFVGMHWWNPPDLMPLVEVLKGTESSDETVQLTVELTRRLGKVPVICKDNPGGLGVRIQAAVILESTRILDEGLASAEDIDTAVKLTLGLRLPVIGPLRIVDLGGMDTFFYAYDHLYKKLGERFKPPNILRRNAEEGKLGLKTNEGFYFYTPEKAEALAKERNRWLMRRAKEITEQK